MARSQAIAIFNRENPTFRSLNYADSVKRKTPSPESNQITPPNKSRKITSRNLSEQPSTSNNQETSDILPPDELTSQNNPVMRAEARTEFENFDPTNEDVSTYENELKASGTSTSVKMQNPSSKSIKNDKPPPQTSEKPGKSESKKKDQLTTKTAERGRSSHRGDSSRRRDRSRSPRKNKK